ncbi:hypothetical protein KBTX_00803 [wastewater metagenome]|uniref:Type-4 uracil-DNA glycosylase n=3 Tax=root TaxID=1 RepID=A0A5B8RCJ8_9ZZZZ|nr:uracil-DNA glycosylase [Arhodomonas sp. KWT]QEA04495.1 hypothetical protein KBTEX_00803 [uncultured organism]
MGAGDRQRVYLERMGIPLWVRRGGSGAASDPGEACPGGGAESASPVMPESPSPMAESPVETGIPAAGASEPPAADGGAATRETVAEPAPAGGGGAAEAEHEAEWTALRREVDQCTACPLYQTRTQAVFGVGSHDASLMIVGEAPGADEDRLGEPFVGRAGRLLDEMLRAIGLAREQVYITNILKSRPPNNRDPRPEEIAACEGYLRRQIELIAPSIMLAVGRVSAQYLLDSDRPLGRLRGRWHEYGPRRTALLVTYHPAYLLRRPVEKRKAWADLKQVHGRLREPGS